MSSSSARQPLYLRSSGATTRAAGDDEFRPEGTASSPERAAPCHEGAAAASVAESDGSLAVLSLPEAHPQLLSHDSPVFADLKGYDHTFGRRPSASVDGSSHPLQKTSAEKRQDGGSWLLGFASLDDAFAPGLVHASSSESESESDEESVSSPPPAATPARKGVSFSSAVKVQPVPHASSLSPAQRGRMYCSSLEIRRNRRRNKKEFRYDGCDWRNAAEERDMGVCQVTGELVHPAHAFELGC